MAFKMKGNVDFGHGTGSSKIKKSQQDIEANAAEEVAMDSSNILPKKSTFKQGWWQTWAKNAIANRDEALNANADNADNTGDAGDAGDAGGDSNAGGDSDAGGPTTRAEAFAAARKAGKATFTWEGKEYHTRRADESKEDWQKKFKTNLPSPGKTPPVNDGSRNWEKSSTKEATFATGTQPSEEAPAEAEATSPEIDRPDYQKRRQEKRISRRKGKAGKDPVYDARTVLKEARMKYGRNSKEFKEAKQALQDAKANK
jgi:hypothetical protein